MGRTGKNNFDQLKGHQVIARFNSEKRNLISHTSKHRGMRSVFEGNVECILDLPIMKKKRKI